MKKVAVTVAVLALGLAACAKNDNADNMTANETYTENAADTDMNAAMTPENAAENALDNASASIENAQDAVDDMAANTTTNQ